MKLLSFNDELEFDATCVKTKVIVETPFSKEIRILLKNGQIMKEHKTPFPILIHILQGKIELGIQSEVYTMGNGNIIALEGDIPHNLTAIEDSIVRLTLSKLDKVERLKNIIDK